MVEQYLIERIRDLIFEGNFEVWSGQFYMAQHDQDMLQLLMDRCCDDVNYKLIQMNRADLYKFVLNRIKPRDWPWVLQNLCCQNYR